MVAAVTGQLRYQYFKESLYTAIPDYTHLIQLCTAHSASAALVPGAGMAIKVGHPGCQACPVRLEYHICTSQAFLP